MKFLCIISGCPTGARKWHISCFAMLLHSKIHALCGAPRKQANSSVHEVLCIIPGCPEGAREWHILFFAMLLHSKSLNLYIICPDFFNCKNFLRIPAFLWILLFLRAGMCYSGGEKGEKAWMNRRCGAEWRPTAPPCSRHGGNTRCWCRWWRGRREED